MSLVVFFSITWLVIMLFYSLTNKLPSKENTIIFFIMSIVIKNSFSIVGVDLQWVEPNTKMLPFLAYIFYRTIIYPTTLLIIVNIFFMSLPKGKKLTYIFLMFLLLFIIENIGVQLNLYRYIKWNNWYNLLEMSASICITILVAKIVQLLAKKENA